LVKPIIGPTISFFFISEKAVVATSGVVEERVGVVVVGREVLFG